MSEFFILIDNWPQTEPFRASSQCTVRKYLRLAILLNINIKCHFIADENVLQCEIQFLVILFWYSTNLSLSWSCWLFLPLVMEILWSICLRRDPQMDRKAVIGGCIYDLSFWISWIRRIYSDYESFPSINSISFYFKILELSDFL